MKILLTLVACCLLAACQGNPTVTSKPEHPAGKTLEGLYRVTFGPYENIREIGTLRLKNGQYSFIAVLSTEQIPQSAVDRFFFVKHPEGYYNLEYQDHLDQNTLLEGLNDFTLLALIRFGASPSTIDALPGSRNAFNLVTDKEGRYLALSSVGNEPAIWSVLKPWD